MSVKHKKIAVYVSMSLFVAAFIYNLIITLTYFANPLDFNLLRLIFTILLLIICVMHIAFLVTLMNVKDKVVNIEDDAEWWKKWDMV